MSEPTVMEGQLSAAGRRFAIVASRFNEFIVKALLDGALDAIRRHGGDLASVDVAWVPGAYEVPLAAKRFALSGRYDAIITLGAVIRGATAHFDYVAGGVSSGVTSVALEANLPVVFGVLTTENIEQAIERAGTKAGNHGFEAAVTAIEMASLLERIDGSQSNREDRLPPSSTETGRA